jgi:hypothetical protein
MKGRNILDGVPILHESVHDFEKAYGKVKWSFLQQTLRMKGFSPSGGL